jgi:hypothetical protein
VADSGRPVPSRALAPPVLLVERDLAPADVPALCQGLPVPDGGTDIEPVVCDVRAITHPDLGTIDALARLALFLRRLGREVRLGEASAELIRLVAFVGLADVLPGAPELAVEMGRQSEEREEPLGVEEEDDPGDPAA